MIRLGILGSTRGTNLLALVEAVHHKLLAATIEVVISNKATALILEKANYYGITNQFINPDGLDRDSYDQQLSELLLKHNVDLVVLIGYMRILSTEFVEKWHNKIINIHPSLLPDFSGLMNLDVHRAVLTSGKKQTGCTVHYVNEQVDAGPIILQKTCLVYENDSAEDLRARVQKLEARALVEAIASIQ